MPLVCGRDAIVEASAGTGKTAACAVAALQKIDASRMETQALILVPTREVAEETQRLFHALGAPMHVRVLAVFGGMDNAVAAAALSAGAPHVVVGTPSRVCDMLHRRALRVDALRLLVVDEADQVLARGFRDLVDEILADILLVEGVQIAIVSGTMPDEALDLCKKCMRSDAVTIRVRTSSLTLQGVRQFYVPVEREEWKLDTLCDIYETLTITQAVVFCSTIARAVQLGADTTHRGNPMALLHEGMGADERAACLRDFRSGAIRNLITTNAMQRTDLAERFGVPLFLHYDLPADIEDYIANVGQSGRGRRKVVINFVITEEMPRLREIEGAFSTSITEMPVDVANLL